MKSDIKYQSKWRWGTPDGTEHSDDIKVFPLCGTSQRDIVQRTRAFSVPMCSRACRWCTAVWGHFYCCLCWEDLGCNRFCGCASLVLEEDNTEPVAPASCSPYLQSDRWVLDSGSPDCKQDELANTELDSVLEENTLTTYFWPLVWRLPYTFRLYILLRELFFMRRAKQNWCFCASLVTLLKACPRVERNGEHVSTGQIPV